MENDKYSTENPKKLSSEIYEVSDLTTEDVADVIDIIRKRLNLKLKKIEGWQDIKYTEGYFKKQLLNELLREL